MLVRYKTCDGTTPSLADILPQSSSTSLAFLPVEMPLNETLGLQQQRRKFQILYDKVVTLHADTNDSTGIFRMVKINKKLSGKIYYTGTNGTDEGNNQLYLFIHTDAVDDVIEESHSYRLFFKDA